MSDDRYVPAIRMYDVPADAVIGDTAQAVVCGADELREFVAAITPRLARWWLRWGCGIGLERRHVGTVVRRVIKTDNSKVRRIP